MSLQFPGPLQKQNASCRRHHQHTVFQIRHPERFVGQMHTGQIPCHCYYSCFRAGEGSLVHCKIHVVRDGMKGFLVALETLAFCLSGIVLKNPMRGRLQQPDSQACVRVRVCVNVCVNVCVLGMAQTAPKTETVQFTHIPNRTVQSIANRNSCTAQKNM